MNIILQHDFFHCLWKTFLVMFHLNNNKNKDKYILDFKWQTKK
jgi:hypothetical protein